MTDYNITLKQFEDISNGTYNAGQIDIKSDGANGHKLIKINNHVALPFLNNTKSSRLSPEKIIAIKESFIKALQDAHLNQEKINEIKKELGLDPTPTNSLKENAKLVDRRYNPLTRQQVKEYIALAKGQAKPENPNKAIQDNVLKSLTKNMDVRNKVMQSLSYLSGLRIGQLQEKENLLAQDLKFFSDQPRYLNKVYEQVTNLIGKFQQNPNDPHLQEESPLFINNDNDILTLKIIKDQNNQPILQGNLHIDNDDIPLNFGVSPQDYLNTINDNLMDFMDFRPDLQDEHNVSLGRTYLNKALADLKQSLSEAQLYSNQNNRLRELCLAILKHNNQNFPQDAERLNTHALNLLAKEQLQQNLPADQLNQTIEKMIISMDLMVGNLQPGQLNQANIQPADPANVQNNNIIEEDEGEDPPPEAYYDAPTYNDNKTATSFANQLFDLAKASLLSKDNKPIDFQTLKTLLSQNADVLLSFASGKAQVGDYEEEQNGEKKLIKSQFNSNQLYQIYQSLCREYEKATGKNQYDFMMLKEQVPDFKKFLEEQITEEKLSQTLAKAMIFVTANIIDSPEPVEGAQAPQAPVKPYPEVKFQQFSTPKETNKFLCGLGQLAKGNDYAAFKAYLWQNHAQFLTFLSGNFEDDPAIDSIHKNEYKKIRADLCKQLHELTGVAKFGEAKPDFTKLTQVEYNKLLVRLNDDALMGKLMQDAGKVPLSIASLHNMLEGEIKQINGEAQKTKGGKEAPVGTYIIPLGAGRLRYEHIQSKNELIGNTDGKNANRVSPYAGDLGTTPGSRMVRRILKDAQKGKVDEIDRIVPDINEKPFSALKFIKAENQAIRKVASFFMSLTQSGDKEQQRKKLFEFVKNNLSSIIYAVSDKDTLKQCLPSRMQTLSDDIYALLKDTLTELTKDVPADILKSSASSQKKANMPAAKSSFTVDNLSYGEYEQLSSYFSSYAEHNVKFPAHLDNALANLEQKLPAILDKATPQIQNLVNTVFKLDNIQKVENPYDHMNAQQIKDTLSKKSVDDIIDDARTGKNIPGKLAFNLAVLKNYFTSIHKSEIALILGDILQTEPSDSNQGVDSVEDNKRMLRAIFKGAGPLFQKMLQGMNKDVADKNYGDLFDELKSNLKHIDHSYVEQTTKGYMSKNKNYNVYTGESLGSATIAETFKCKISYRQRHLDAGWSSHEKEVVIKVMRPGVKQRAENEIKIFNEAAKQVPGMTEEWNAQLADIMKEFDFVNEAKNIDMCQNVFQVKNNQASKDIHIAPNVATLKRNDTIPVQNDVIMTELIEGETVDKTYTNLEQEFKLTFGKYFELDSETGDFKLDKQGMPVIKDGIDARELLSARRSIPYDYQQIFKVNQLINEAIGKWLKEVLFNSGIIHNDIHGGNLMISGYGENQTITFIDFGNMQKISPETQLKFKDLLVYTMHRNTQGFVDTLTSMLPKPPTDAQKEKMTAIVDTIMQKGHSTSDAGYRFSAMIGELRKIGLTFPSEFYGVTNGLNRLQSFADNSAKLLNKYYFLYNALMGKKQLAPAVSTTDPQQKFDGNLFNKVTEAVLKDSNCKAGLQQVNIAMQEINSPNSELRTQLPHKILKDAFEGDFAYTDSFIKEREDRHDIDDSFKYTHNFDKRYADFKKVIREAKEKGVSLQLITDLLADPNKAIPENLAAHQDLIKSVISSFKDFNGLVVDVLKKAVNSMHYAIQKTNDGESNWQIKYSLDPELDEQGKVIKNPIEDNQISVEGTIGKLLTEANNFSATSAQQPMVIVEGDIIDNTRTEQKPLVEVTENPMGHQPQEIQLAS